MVFFASIVSRKGCRAAVSAGLIGAMALVAVACCLWSGARTMRRGGVAQREPRGFERKSLPRMAQTQCEHFDQIVPG